MIKDHLLSVVEELCSLIDSWNDAQADGDRGRGHDSLILCLNPSGVGFLGTLAPSAGITVVNSFTNEDGLVEALKYHQVEIQEDVPDPVSVDVRFLIQALDQHQEDYHPMSLMNKARVKLADLDRERKFLLNLISDMKKDSSAYKAGYKDGWKDRVATTSLHGQVKS